MVERSRRLLIVGRNSTVLRALEPMLTGFAVTALSHEEALNAASLQDPIVFAYARDPEANGRFIDDLVKKSRGTLTLISSVVCECPDYCDAYQYVRSKKRGEQRALQEGRTRILRLGSVLGDTASLAAFVGDVPVTRLSQLSSTLGDLSRFEAGKIHACYTLERGSGGAYLRALHESYSAVARLAGKRLPLLRPIDAAFKVLGYRQYGYAHLAGAGRW